MAAIFSYQSVEICYNGIPAVQDVSFTLQPGEILGIVGESGSGKSTILKAAMGLLGRDGAVTKGSIWFQEKNLPDLPGREMRKICGREIGMVFQDAGASLCPIRIIGSQIFESIAAHEKTTRKETNRRALELFDKLGFPDGKRILSSYPFELSGGMNQRVGIAMAMLLQPGILLADEPTSALDVSVQQQVMQEMRMMRRLYGTAMILVTHNIGVVSAMADSILVLQGGRLMEYGKTRQVLDAPRSEYTKSLLAAMPRLRRN